MFLKKKPDNTAMLEEPTQPFRAVEYLLLLHKCSIGCDDETQTLELMIEYEVIWYFDGWIGEAATPRYIDSTLGRYLDCLTAPGANWRDAI